MGEDEVDLLRVMIEGSLGSETEMTRRLARLCELTLGHLGLQSAAVTLRTEDHQDTVVASSGDGERLADLRITAGDGPAHDAFVLRRPVLVSDLHPTIHRWPGYAPLAREAGVGAVFAFPLQVGAVRFGVLTLYSNAPRLLTAQETARALVIAEVATEVLLESGATGPDGAISFPLDRVLHIRSEVYQAQGMVMVDLGVSLAEAMLRIRAHAYSTDSDMNDVALEIVAGHLRLPRDDAR